VGKAGVSCLNSLGSGRWPFSMAAISASTEAIFSRMRSKRRRKARRRAEADRPEGFAAVRPLFFSL